MNPIEISALIEHQRSNLSAFIQRTFSIISAHSTYKHNWHIDCIAEYLEATRKGEITRLIINIPPRFLKSISCSVAFPAWLLGHNPAEQILCASYSKELAMTHSVNCRNVMVTDWYQTLFPKTILADDQNTKTKFKTTVNGVRYAVGVDGTITGEGGNFIIIDDPISAKESNSRLIRDNANNWLGQTAHNRLNDKKNGVIILIMQRLHLNDPTGYLLDLGGWEHLKIPLIAEGNKIYEIGTFKKEVKEGDLLHPTFMNGQAIEREKRIAGAYHFAGQFMQNPSPTGGGEFRQEWIQYYRGKLEPSTMNVYIMVDPANSKKTTSDYTAIVVAGLGSDENIYILDLIRDRLNLRERQEMLFKLHAKYKPKAVIYEKYGMQADIEAMNEAMGYLNYRFAITEVGGALNKEDRIRRLIPYFTDGRVWLPQTLYKTDYEGKVIDVIEEFVHQELLPFPVGLHDDCIDSLSRLFDANLIWPGKHNFDYYNFAEGFK